METLGVWIVVLSFCNFSPWSYGEFAPDDFEEKLIALYKVLDYINERPGQMNADVTFSLTMVEANLAAGLVHENVRYLGDEHRRTLWTILQLCDSTRRRLLDEIVPQNKDVRLLHEMLNYPILWMKKIPWRLGSLKKAEVNVKLSSRDVKDLVMQGTPKEKESDRCIAKIIQNKLNSNHRIPDLCLEILTNRGSNRGYPLTHRLLIVQVSRTMKCEQGVPSSKLIPSYCSAIYQDLIDIEAAGFPYQTPDLMMEQVVLCGMEGFREFTGKHYERLILGWAHPSGCFSSFGGKFFGNEARLSRRASTQTDFGCDGHATGLAAASISLFIRENLETAHE